MTRQKLIDQKNMDPREMIFRNAERQPGQEILHCYSHSPFICFKFPVCEVFACLRVYAHPTCALSTEAGRWCQIPRHRSHKRLWDTMQQQAQVLQKRSMPSQAFSHLSGPLLCILDTGDSSKSWGFGDKLLYTTQTQPKSSSHLGLHISFLVLRIPSFWNGIFI